MDLNLQQNFLPVPIFRLNFRFNFRFNCRFNIRSNDTLKVGQKPLSSKIHIIFKQIIELSRTVDKLYPVTLICGFSLVLKFVFSKVLYCRRYTINRPDYVNKVQSGLKSSLIQGSLESARCEFTYRSVRIRSIQNTCVKVMFETQVQIYHWNNFEGELSKLVELN